MAAEFPSETKKLDQPDQEVSPDALTEVTAAAECVVPGEAGAKKKRKRKKKGTGVTSSKSFTVPALENKEFIALGAWPESTESPIDFPPTIPVDKAYLEEAYPAGDQRLHRSSEYWKPDENSSKPSFTEANLADLRRAAECHRQARRYVQSIIKPGIKLSEMCQKLEATVKQLVSANLLESGWAFPTGCSLNNVAAHYTPNTGDDTCLGEKDIMKLDFGVHVGGNIIDSAFSVAFNPKFETLIEASRSGTEAGLKAAGVDARFSEIGADIQEAIESYEMEVGGKVLRIRPVANLNGHSIGSYRIHAGKSVPIIKTTQSTRMEEGELYAIETFATTGTGNVVESGECSHYMRSFDVGHVPLRLKSAKILLQAIDHNFGTLAFCRRWLDELGQTRHLMALKNLVDAGIVEPYPPLADEKGSFVSQTEHTVLLRPTCKEILSRGPDY